MVKAVLSTQTISIPKNVSIEVSSRHVKVIGPRGSLSRSFKHTHLDIYLINPRKDNKGFKNLKVDFWLGKKKQTASIRTVCSHIKNMITGVTRGFEYKMRFVFAHFPITVNITNAGKELEVRNFIGEKMVRKVPMLDGVTIARNEKVKDEIVLTGNDIGLVSQSAANVQQSTSVKNKDIRKFLDGIYVSEKNVLEELVTAEVQEKGKGKPGAPKGAAQKDAPKETKKPEPKEPKKTESKPAAAVVEEEEEEMNLSLFD